MSNCWINIRFGAYHFQLTHDPIRVTWSKNSYWVERKPDPWFKVYEFFWYQG